MRKRKIIAVSGIRSEYDILSTVLFEIQNQPGCELGVVVTGAHLSEMYGCTVNEIRKDGFNILDEIHSLINSDSPASRVRGLGIQLQGLTQTILREKPDLLLVLGDREEALSTAIAGNYMNVPVAHISGGDRVVGNVDDQVRHAVTKLSHIHFATNQASFERILNLGEQPFRVFNSGNPGLDRFVQVPTLSMGELSERLKFQFVENEPLILLIQHPLSSEVGASYEQMRVSLEVVCQLAVKTVVVFPNSDPGSHHIIRAIKEYEELPFIHVEKSIPRLEFVNLMRNTNCMLGNSSAGILEAPLLKLPVVNVGNRQKERLHAENVQFVPHDREQICLAMKKALYDAEYRARVQKCASPYGDGKAAQKIVNVLRDIPIDSNLLIKDITY